jgi:hypothetical protein
MRERGERVKNALGHHRVLHHLSTLSHRVISQLCTTTGRLKKNTFSSCLLLLQHHTVGNISHPLIYYYLLLYVI